MSDVTVIIPAYRAEATIGRALDSVLAQQAVAVRVIVVVDGEFDRTAEIVASYADKKVEMIVNARNRGAPYSRNAGLAEARSPFVMFLDSDDYIEGPLLAGLLAALRREEVDLGLAPYRMIDSVSGRVMRRFVPDFASPADLFMRWFGHGRWESVRSDMVPPCSVMWRTDAIRSIGGWDQSIRRNQDGELVARAVLRGARIAVSAEGAGVYMKYAAPGSISSRTDTLESLLDVSDKIFAIESTVISRTLQERACAAHDYGIAWRCFAAGRNALGMKALARSRSRGFHGHWGSPPMRLAAHLFGLQAAFRLRGLFVPDRRSPRAPAVAEHDHATPGSV